MKIRNMLLGLFVGFMVVVFIGGIVIKHLSSESMAFPDTEQPTSNLLNFGSDTSKPTLLVLHKTGCSDCKLVAKTFAVSKRELGNRVNFVIVDAKNDNSKGIIKNYQITNAPTFIWLKNGKEVSRYSGSNKSILKNFLNFQKAKEVTDASIS